MDRKIIIFDMDGVLVDTIPYAREAFLKRHKGLTVEMFNEINSGNWHKEAEKYSHLKIPETEEEKSKREATYVETKSRTPLFDGVESLLNSLRTRGYTLVLNTNAHDKHCFPLLENRGIRDFFDFIATAEISKDKVEKFKLIEEKYEIRGKDALFVTDALGDVRDAATAGVPTIAVTWGVHDRSYFEREQHAHLVGIVDTTDGLLNLILEYWV